MAYEVPNRSGPPTVGMGGLAVFLFCSTVIGTVILTTVCQGPPEEVPAIKVVRQTRKFTVGYDSWRPMEKAYAHTQSSNRKNLYEQIFFKDRVKFQYPPTALLLNWTIDQLRTIGVPRVQGLFILGLSWLGYFVSVLGSAYLLIKTAFGKRFPNQIPPKDWVYWALCTGLFLAFYPVIKALELGQIQIILSGLFVAAVLLWTFDRPLLAGSLVGLMTMVKPQYGLLLVWGLLPFQGRFVVALLVTAGLGLVASLLLFGLPSHVGYLDVVSFLGARGEAFHPNQAFNGFLNRWFENGVAIGWLSDAFPPPHAMVRAGTMVTSVSLVALLVLWLWTNRRQKPSVDGFFITAITCTLASPIAWEHHFSILLPMYGLLFGRAVAGDLPLSRFLILCVSYFLVSNFFLPLDSWLKPPLVLLSVPILIGAILLLMLLYKGVPMRGQVGAKPAN